MKTKLIPAIIIMCLGLSVQLKAQPNFYAYYTKVSHTSTDYFGKYADLVVVLDEDSRLEFTRRTQYQPKWITPNGEFMVDEFFPGRDIDYNNEYSFVRLIEKSPEKIVVHWRYIPDIKVLEEANAMLNSTLIEGFTGVVHEMFTIYPDGKIEREVKDARGSVYETWIAEDYGHRQTLHLKNNGIEHGPVTWGNTRGELPETVDMNPVISTKGLVEPMLAWTFDEGGLGFDEDIEEDEAWELLHVAIESQTEDWSEIAGHMALYKKGVSGTALGFDGYYTGVTLEDDEIDLGESLTLEAWLALDVYPFNEAPVIHRSEGFGESGFYLGVNAYGKLFLRINGEEAVSEETLPLYQWKHVAASWQDGLAMLFLDGEKVGEFNFSGDLGVEAGELTIGLNTEKERCTDYVREFDQNLLFIYGIQGLLDEVKVYEEALKEDQVRKHYEKFVPENRKSDLAKAVLPGEVGVAEKFGAAYKTLEFHELWDRMWRITDKSDIVVKFDDSPASVVYWRGTNFAANWVTDNNRWMADQSSEIFTDHGCSEHMADKQTRHSYARIIENNDARVVMHWRYPCVDVSYLCIDRKNYTDEYHTIYPDATGIRKVVYNNSTVEPPGFQDVQWFSNPGETALDVLELNAETLANTKGETFEMVWEKPNKNPRSKLDDATIQYVNSKSDWKVYAIYPEPGIGTWGNFEQSKYTDDPFAGPWNHWPVSIVPSDGRFAVFHDRVTHFALGAGDSGPDHVVHYGFTNNEVKSLIPAAKYWQQAPEIKDVTGGKTKGFSQAEKAYIMKSDGSDQFGFTIDATRESPVVNPAFVIYNCYSENVSVKVDGKLVPINKDCRVGQEYDTKGNPKMIIWMRYENDAPVSVELSF